MYSLSRPWLAAALLGLACGPAVAQQPSTPPPAPLPPPAAAAPQVPTGVAATVNGQPVMEVAVQRALNNLHETARAEARSGVVNYLIDNLLIDQHLIERQVAVDDKAVAEGLKQVYDELQKTKQDPKQLMRKLMLTEQELQTQIAADLRWDKYAGEQATDATLKAFFEANPEMFDGSMVRARHILLMPQAGNAKAQEEARAQLQVFKKQVEERVAAGLAKPPAETGKGALDRESKRTQLIEAEFAALAREKSACPSKKDGGALPVFPRLGAMVEPFAKAAFALKAYEISDVVTTPFGHHLILVTERMPGKTTKFEDVKAEVKAVYCYRLRQPLATKLRESAKVVINPPPKP